MGGLISKVTCQYMYNVNLYMSSLITYQTDSTMLIVEISHQMAYPFRVSTTCCVHSCEAIPSSRVHTHQNL
jgi:hypothetical protein